MKRLLLLLLLPACAVQVSLIPSGGSKADGVIELSYSYGQYQTPEVDYQQGLIKAIDRCMAWGYRDAEAFGYGSVECIYSNDYGCRQYTVTHSYQCVDVPREPIVQHSPGLL